MAVLGQFADDINEHTSQEVFENVITHLIEQGEVSNHPSNGCMYKGENGKCCAAAIYMKDYKPSFETHAWHTLLNGKDIESSKHDVLIDRLQVLHDSFECPEHKGRINKINMLEVMNKIRYFRENKFDMTFMEKL